MYAPGFWLSATVHLCPVFCCFTSSPCTPVVWQSSLLSDRFPALNPCTLPGPASVQVTLHEARDLPVWGFPWQSNPYCRITLGSQAVQVRHPASHRTWPACSSAVQRPCALLQAAKTSSVSAPSMMKFTLTNHPSRLESAASVLLPAVAARRRHQSRWSAPSPGVEPGLPVPGGGPHGTGWLAG